MAELDVQSEIPTLDISATFLEEHFGASSITSQSKLKRIQKKYGIPPTYNLRLAAVGERPNATFSPVEICIFEDQLAMGLSIPLLREINELSMLLQIIPAQIMPNVIATLNAFLAFFKDHSIESSLPQLFSFLALHSQRGAYFFHCKRNSQILAKNLPTSHKGWRNGYFFITSPTPSECCCQPGFAPAEITQLTARSEELSQLLNSWGPRSAMMFDFEGTKYPNLLPRRVMLTDHVSEGALIPPPGKKRKSPKNTEGETQPKKTRVAKPRSQKKISEGEPLVIPIAEKPTDPAEVRPDSHVRSVGSEEEIEEIPLQRKPRRDSPPAGISDINEPRVEHFEASVQPTTIQTVHINSSSSISSGYSADFNFALTFMAPLRPERSPSVERAIPVVALDAPLARLDKGKASAQSSSPTEDHFQPLLDSLDCFRNPLDRLSYEIPADLGSSDSPNQQYIRINPDGVSASISAPMEIRCIAGNLNPLGSQIAYLIRLEKEFENFTLGEDREVIHCLQNQLLGAMRLSDILGGRLLASRHNEKHSDKQFDTIVQIADELASVARNSRAEVEHLSAIFDSRGNWIEELRTQMENLSLEFDEVKSACSVISEKHWTLEQTYEKEKSAWLEEKATLMKEIANARSEVLELKHQVLDPSSIINN